MKRWISMMLAWTMAVSCALGEMADDPEATAQPESTEAAGAPAEEQR